MINLCILYLWPIFVYFIYGPSMYTLSMVNLDQTTHPILFIIYQWKRKQNKKNITFIKIYENCSKFAQQISFINESFHNIFSCQECSDQCVLVYFSLSYIINNLKKSLEKFFFLGGGGTDLLFPPSPTNIFYIFFFIFIEKYSPIYQESDSKGSYQ